MKDDIDIFKGPTKPKESVKKEKKALTLKNAHILFSGRQKVLNVFETGIFPKGKQGKGLKSILDCVAKASDSKHLKILTPKQILQRSLIVLAQVKAGNTAVNWINKIRQIIYSFYRAK